MGRIVFRNANLLDREHPARHDQTIAVDDDTIVQIDESPSKRHPTTASSILRAAR